MDVQGMLGIDKCSHAAFFLRFGSDMQCQGGLAGGFRPVNLDDTSTGDAAYA